tara:strand:+ start:9407 stop:9862 length:456 start_codon:yes stop_codon:yes gene_type:complete
MERCVWFAIHAHAGRAWGCHVMLESGAVYRGVPPHALAFDEEADTGWELEDAQIWDCYGTQFSVIEYDYLAGLRTLDHKQREGRYMFTVVPLNDPYTQAPDQSKEFMFIEGSNGRLSILPTNKLLFRDASFTTTSDWPTDLKISDQVWRVE